MLERFDSPRHSFHVVRLFSLGIVKLGRHNKRREKWLEAFPDIRKKYLNQCVMCQEIGYDPVKIEMKQGRIFQKRLREWFHPLEVNEAGICTDCDTRNLRYERNDA